jgi:multiple sugar transport system substrate-binding protein
MDPPERGRNMASIFDTPMTRRQLLRNSAVFGAATFAVTSLGACTGGSGDGGDGGGGGGSDRIVIGSFQDNALAPLRDTFFKRFEDETGIKVQYNETNYDSWYQNAKNDGLQQTGAYDIYLMDDNWVPEFAAAGILVDLEAAGLKLNPDLQENGLNQGYWPPRTGPKMADFASDEPRPYAVPIDNDVQMLYYNADHFSDPPATWDDVFATMKDVAGPDLYGWSIRGVKGNPIVQTYLPFLNSYGGAFVNDDWTPGFAGPEGVGALERIFSFIPYMAPGIVEFDTDQETQVLLQGQCLALTEYTGLTQRIDDPESSTVVDKINCAATPAQERNGAAIGIFNAGIPPSAPNPDGAVQFLDWFTSDAVQLDFAKTGSAAVTRVALTDPSAVAEARWLPAIADAVDSATPKPRTPDEPKFEDILGTHLNLALVEAIDAGSNFTGIAQKHLKAAADEMAAYMQDQGGYS